MPTITFGVEGSPMAEWDMDRWKYYSITHRDHVVCNPLSVGKMEELCWLLRLRPGAKALDIACGKAEFLVRLAERFNIEGVGVDLSPYFIEDAEKKRRLRFPDANLKFICLDGADYKPDAPESFDLAMCIGASWIFGGHRGALRALKGMVKPGGLAMVGEPFWIQKPPSEYLALIGEREETFGTHYGNVAAGENEGLECLYTMVSSQDDWDRYEGLQWYAASNYASKHPEDPDVPSILERVSNYREAYLRWGRDALGWAVYLFRRRSP